MEPHSLEESVRHFDTSSHDGLKKLLMKIAQRADMVEKHCGLLPKEEERKFSVVGGAEVEKTDKPEFDPHFLGKPASDAPLVKEKEGKP